MMRSPPAWSCGEPLAPADYARLVRRAAFDCCKWHTQADDLPVLCPFPLLLDSATWDHLARTAAALASETTAAEEELLRRPELHERLGLPGALRRCLRQVASAGPAAGAARVMRFDFHWTTEGWRISEANTDVAAGFIEASGVTHLLAAHYPGCRPTGDPAGALAAAIRRAAEPVGPVGLMHLTVYTEDRQVMLYLARRLGELGAPTCLLSPTQLRWVGGRAEIATGWYTGRAGLVVRFFPADWLPRLPRASGWAGFFAGGQTPTCNPGYAVLTQSKRFALTWNDLATPLPTWRALLPETRSPRDVGEESDWVHKPALAHEGTDVGIRGVVETTEWQRIRRAALRDPRMWAAQRRFEALPLETPDGPLYPCVGVYVIDGAVAGAYGRAGTRPLIDYLAREIAVLVRAVDTGDRLRSPLTPASGERGRG
jgi:glutathionylspermidine synthase